MGSYDIYLFHYYSLVSLLNRLYKLNIDVRKYLKKDEFNFYLKIHRRYRKLIKENFSDFKIVDKIGILNSLEKIVLKPSLFISLICSIALFFNLTNRIYVVDIRGDFPSIEGQLLEFLNNEGIKYFSFNIDNKKIKEIEVKMKGQFDDDIEFVELVKNGGVVSLNYKKRRKKLVIKEKKGSLYASKDGVIRKFEISSGVKNVKRYDYVKKGDLLISDILIDTNDNNVYVGSVGKVFASTFYYVEVRCDTTIEDVDKQVYLLDKARTIVGKNLNSDDEYIESENILVNDIKNGYMKIYYVLYEDITI